MFETMFFTGGSGRERGRKGLTFSLSLILHALAVAAVIVVPLLHAESRLPEFAVIDAALISPPDLPGIPPAGRPRGGDGRSGIPGEEPVKPRPHGRIEFTVPKEITKSTEEDLTSALAKIGGGIGVDGGINLDEGGNSEWEIGKEYVPETIDPGRTPVIHVTPPRLARRVSPAYPPEAIAARLAGPVVIDAMTDIYGKVKEAHVISGHPLLNAAALRAVREWTYEPYLVNGIPHAVRFTVTVNFVLDKR